MSNIDLEQLRMKVNVAPKLENRRALPRHRQGEKFLAGPIPWSWWAIASRLPGRALQVSSAIWFLMFVKKSVTVRLGGKILRDLGVSRKAGYRALKGLEKAGLISCERHSGRSPIITVKDVSDSSVEEDGRARGDD